MAELVGAAEERIIDRIEDERHLSADRIRSPWQFKSALIEQVRIILLERPYQTPEVERARLQSEERFEQLFGDALSRLDVYDLDQDGIWDAASDRTDIGGDENVNKPRYFNVG